MRKLSLLILCFALLCVAVPTFAQDATATPSQPTAEATQQTAATSGQPAAFIRFANFDPNATVTFSSADNKIAASKPVDFKGFSDWMAIPPGKYSISASSSGANAAKTEDTEFDFKENGWFTVAAFATANGDLRVESIDQTVDKILPGTSSMTLVNATQGEINVDFLRDDTTYSADLFPMGNPSNKTSRFNILDDAKTYHYKVVQNAKPDTVLADAPNTNVRENELYLIAVVGDPSKKSTELVVNNTDMAQVNLLEGKMQAPGTIIQAAAAHPELAAWLDAVQKAGLTDTLSGKGPFTVFANANFDMSKLPSNLQSDTKALADFLKAQIVAGDLRSRDVFKAGALNTLAGQTLNLKQKDNNAYVNGAQIIDVNIPATNGVIHVVNDFVTPPQS